MKKIPASIAKNNKQRGNKAGERAKVLISPAIFYKSGKFHTFISDK